VITRLAELRPRISAYVAQLSAAQHVALAAIGAAVAAALAFSAAHWAQAARANAEATRAEHAVLARLAAEDGAPLDLRAEAQKARDYAILADTAIDAGRQAQSLIVSMAQEAGVQNPRVTIRGADAHAVQVSIEGDFDWTVFQELLRTLSASSESFAPTALELRTGESARFRLDLQAATAAAT